MTYEEINKIQRMVGSLELGGTISTADIREALRILLKRAIDDYYRNG